MNEKILLDKWQTLEPDEQEKVIAFIDDIKTNKSDYTPKTELGKKLWKLRIKSLGKHPLLNTWEEVEKELAERRGGIQK